MDQINEIAMSTASKILMVVIDGLGGLPDPETGLTELETARTPNLDSLVKKGTCGLTYPVSPGITPGSAPGHLALFGYDPVKCLIGRGVLEATGIDFDLQPEDIAARGNFATIDDQGRVTDRRAGRISTEKCAELCRLLDGEKMDGVKILVRPVREHRCVVIFRGKDLQPDLTDSDPLVLGVAPKTVTANTASASRMADIADRFLAEARKKLAGHHPANMLLLRGFSRHPSLPSMKANYRLNPAAIAVYPMYRGLARLVGMKVINTGTTIEQEFVTLQQIYNDFDFFFLHVKGADSAGEDGDFARKVKVIEQVDKAMTMAVSLNPEVIVVTGDHSTPARLKGHSWHPVPLLLYSKWCRRDNTDKFSETACLSGSLGRIPAKQVMPLALAHALKLEKFGA